MKENFKKTEKDFIRLADAGNLFHAYLFFGESAEEILDFSKKLANYMETGDFAEPKKFLNDFLFIQPNEFGNIGIDRIRDLQYFLFQKPAISKRRVAVILGADAMSDESTGAVLKIIEEPPQKSLVILISRHDDVLPETVLSRVHKVYFSAAAGQKKEKIGKDSEIENQDTVFKNIILDLKKNLGDNVLAAKEILKRISLMKRYNLNHRLQMRVISHYLKNKNQVQKRKSYGN